MSFPRLPFSVLFYYCYLNCVVRHRHRKAMREVHTKGTKAYTVTVYICRKTKVRHGRWEPKPTPLDLFFSDGRNGNLEAYIKPCCVHAQPPAWLHTLEMTLAFFLQWCFLLKRRTPNDDGGTRIFQVRSCGVCF